MYDCIAPSSVPTTNRCSEAGLKSKQHPPARPSMARWSGTSSWSLVPLMSFSSTTSSFTKSDLVSTQFVTRPSELTEKKFRGFPASSRCQRTSQTGSVCLDLGSEDT